MTEFWDGNDEDDDFERDAVGAGMTEKGRGNDEVGA